MKIRNLFNPLILCIALLFSASVFAVGTININELNDAQITEKINELTGKLSSDEISQDVKQDLNKIIELLKRYQLQYKHMQEIRHSVTERDQIIEKYKKLNNDLKKNFDKISDLEKKINSLTLDNLNKSLNEAKEQQHDTLKNYNQYKNYSEMLLATTEYVQPKTVAMQEEIENDKKQLESGKLRQSEEDFYSLRIQTNTYNIDYYQYLNSSHGVLQELLTTVTNYYQIKLEYDNKVVDLYQQRLGVLQKEQTKEESKKIREELLEITVDPTTSSHTSEYIVKQNSQLRDKLNAVSEQMVSMKQELENITGILSQTNKIENSVNNQISTFKESLYLSQMLHKQLFDIPQYNSSYNIEDLITNLRFELYDTNTKLTNIQKKDRYRRRLSRKFQEKLTDEQENVVDALLDYQGKILNLYRNKLTEELTLMVNIKVKSDLYRNTKSNIKETVNKQLFWLQSNSKMTLNWFKNFPSLAKRELLDTETSINTRNLLDEGSKNLAQLIILFLLSILILLNQKKLVMWINESNKLAAKPKTDTYMSVIKASFWTAVKSLNWPMWSLIIGYILSYMHPKIGIYDIGQIIKVNNIRLAIIIWIWAFSYHFYKENSINKIHFKREFNKNIQWYHMGFLGLLVCLSLLCSCKLHYLETLPTDVIGQAIFILILLCIELILIRVTVLTFRNKMNLINKCLSVCYLFIPLILISRIYYGYFYSAIVISVRIIETYFFIFIMNFLYFVIRKFITITKYRLNYKRKLNEALQKKNDSVSKAISNNSEIPLGKIDDDELTIEDIDKQTSSIFNCIFVALCLFMLHYMWSDIIGILSYLNTITLWNITGTDASGKITILNSISITDVAISLLSIVLMVILTKNIPGLLEVTLNKFATTKNASYSIKTILTYIIITTCTIVCLGHLGVTWDNLQWLVAALSVGLGFGLQEIFGNFVSGLILLFERPIRLGDIVTIGDVSGTVTRIRIRATTIMQFDKKELIVPNKKFITESLTNWTLSDTVTRIEISVGVSYNENLDIVQRNLLDIANKCPYVAKEPAPKAYFMRFGDSNLDHSLYVYVNTISERYPAINYLNKAIYNRFKDLNIEIAYNQIDMYIKNVKTEQEIKIDATPREEKK